MKSSNYKKNKMRLTIKKTYNNNKCININKREEIIKVILKYKKKIKFKIKVKISKLMNLV